MTNDICQRCRQRIKAGVCLCAFLTGFGAALVTGDEPPPSSTGGAIMSSFLTPGVDGRCSSAIRLQAALRHSRVS
jgi:hypothetical protein